MDVFYKLYYIIDNMEMLKLLFLWYYNSVTKFIKKDDGIGY